MDMRTVVVIVGTVPEAVKLGPVCRALGRYAGGLRTRVLVSGQHGERVPPILALFGIRRVEHLADGIECKHLSTMGAWLLAQLGAQLRSMRPDLVVVQGDTATAYAGALAAFYEGFPIAHVEAGLTSGDVSRPYPEELHREVISRSAAMLFAPSLESAARSARIARPGAVVYLTGNPCVDALLRVLGGKNGHMATQGRPTRRRVLVTVHRRENHGCVGERIGDALARLARDRRDVELVFVRHPHPALDGLAQRLEQCECARVLPPQTYPAWLRLLRASHMVLSDSGGAQEEAPWFKKPLLVLREETERPEIVRLGAARLVGTDPDAIYETATALLQNDRLYRRMQLDRSQYPYGFGKAARQIARHIHTWLAGRH